MGNEMDVAASRPQVKGYVQAQAGNVRFAGGSNVADIGAKLGGTFQYKGLKVDGQIGAGTTLNAKLGADFNIPVSKTMGVEIGGSARVDRQMKSTNVTSTLNAYESLPVTISYPDINVNYNGQQIVLRAPNETKIIDVNYPESTAQSGFHKTNLTSEMHAGVNFKSNKGSLSVGAMLANRSSLNSDITHHLSSTAGLDININPNLNVNIEGLSPKEQIQIDHQLKKYNQPQSFHWSNTKEAQHTFEKPSSELVGGIYAKGEYNLNKSGSIQAFADGSLLGGKAQGQAGIRWTF